MSDMQPRMAREQKTVEAMIDLYCRDHHGTEGALCDECMELRQYALARLQKCPFQEGKTTCAQCPVHCYKPAMREKIRAVITGKGLMNPEEVRALLTEARVSRFLRK